MAKMTTLAAQFALLCWKSSVHGAHCETAFELMRNDGEALKQVDEYIYLGQLIKLKKDHDSEIKRRINIGWMTFGKNKDILKSKMPICLKRKIYNQCEKPAMTYGCETWKLTKRAENSLRIAQREIYSLL